MKACKTALYGEIKERRQTGGEWLIGAHTQNIPYLLLVTTQDKKTKAHKVPIDEGKSA